MVAYRSTTKPPSVANNLFSLFILPMVLPMLPLGVALKCTMPLTMPLLLPLSFPMVPSMTGQLLACRSFAARTFCNYMSAVRLSRAVSMNWRAELLSMREMGGALETSKATHAWRHGGDIWGAGRAESPTPAGSQAAASSTARQRGMAARAQEPPLRNGDDAASAPGVGAPPRHCGCLPGVPPSAVPIAYVEASLARAVGASAGPIWLSPETAAKQRRRHPELSERDYLQAAGAFGDCEVVKEGRNGYSRHLLFLVKRGTRHAWRWWKAAVKATEDGAELYLVTLHPLESREVDVIRDAGWVLREARGRQRVAQLFSLHGLGG
ncbi:unnamed protein product [Prorocentrum cordatum]|uniref:Uncharacterized protein n=1 Tax=Prorocentrum cordatum TaxID=2364126 RepID=A0ABN9TRI7_9DINO|nr:unnamed protein product [Polarella glacialis]